MTTTTSATGARVKTPVGPQIGPYIFGKTLGTGATGKVKLAKHVETGELTAIKIVRKEFLMRKPSLKKKLQREITVMKLCNHPNVLRLLDVFEIDTHLFLVLEYVDGCELFQYLVNHGPLPSEQALQFFRQVIAGLDYCHKRLICHRDLKPENLLLDRNLRLRVADFGMTNLNPPGSLLETSCGSPHYAAPEVISGEMYNGLEADIWSCGVILYAMVTGRLPFDDDNIQRLLLKVQRGVFHFPQGMDPEIKALIKGMMTVDPKKRMTIADIKQNAWFNSIPDDAAFDDDFKVPEEPIINPNPAVLQGLVDLGWGDRNSIKQELASNEANIVKVFYIQLEKHPMFHKNAEPAKPKDSVKVEVATSQPVSVEQMQAQPPGQYGTSPSNESLIRASSGDKAPKKEVQNRMLPEGITTPVTPPTVPMVEKRASDSKPPEETGKTPAERTPATGMTQSPSLIRQSELTGRKEEVQKENAEFDVSTLTIHERPSAGKRGTSWFDAFTKYFIGGNV